MAIELVVVQPFAGYQVGDVVTDIDQVAAILDGEHAGHVVTIAIPGVLTADEPMKVSE